jgi:hypothetical protein
VCTRKEAGVYQSKKSPSIQKALEELVEGETAGDPMSDHKWQRSSLRHFSAELTQDRHLVSHTTVGWLLVKMDYSLKANLKRFSGASRPDRNQQFEYIEAQKRAFLEAGWPVISVNTRRS